MDCLLERLIVAYNKLPYRDQEALVKLSEDWSGITMRKARSLNQSTAGESTRPFYVPVRRRDS